MNTGNILVVDDNKNVLSALRILLENYFASVQLLNNPNQLPSKLKEFSPDVVLLDMNFSAGINTGNEGIYWLSEIKKQDVDLPVVLFTAFADIELAVRALKEGASDFVVKPWDNAKLGATLQSAYSLRQSRKEVKRLREKQDALNSAYLKDNDVCWGKSSVMHSLRAMIEKVAKTDANVLITGENGTGKEVIARELHRLSLRSSEAFVAVDMGAVAGTLFESEFFGHVKGAFTDARTDRAGKFEAAQDGTLFLDEIGNLEASLQAKLLTVLQSRQIVRVGGNKPVPVDIRLICATNRNLFQMVHDKQFREDLLYRSCIISSDQLFPYVPVL
jgi:DNA-binding NtrC family response regulator